MLAVMIRFKGSMKGLVPSLETFHATSLRSSTSPSPPHYFKEFDKGAVSATKCRLCGVNRMFTCLSQSCQFQTKLPVFTAYHKSTACTTCSHSMCGSMIQAMSTGELVAWLISMVPTTSCIKDSSARSVTGVQQIGKRLCNHNAVNLIKIVSIDSKLKLDVCSVITLLTLETAASRDVLHQGAFPYVTSDSIPCIF